MITELTSGKITRGHSLNKLQNGIILLIFKIWKNQTIGFVHNLLGQIYRNFYQDDVIIVTSPVHRIVGKCSILPIPHHSPSVKNTTASYRYQKNEHVQQWNLFKCQISTFCFSAYCAHLFKHLLTHTGQTRLLQSARSFSSTTLLHPWANFLHQTCIDGLNTCHHILDASQSEWHLASSFAYSMLSMVTLMRE